MLKWHKKRSHARQSRSNYALFPSFKMPPKKISKFQPSSQMSSVTTKGPKASFQTLNDSNNNMTTSNSQNPYRQTPNNINTSTTTSQNAKPNLQPHTDNSTTTSTPISPPIPTPPHTPNCLPPSGPRMLTLHQKVQAMYTAFCRMPVLTLTASELTDIAVHLLAEDSAEEHHGTREGWEGFTEGWRSRHGMVLMQIFEKLLRERKKNGDGEKG